MKKYQNMNTHMNTSSKKPYRYKVFMNEQDTDKGEVGSSSLPRPTSLFRLYKGFREFHLWNSFAVGLAIALSIDVIMNVLHFVGLVW